ncbi:MAG: hypothetical protein AAF088_21690 [Pseudomonadota bacterium]
MKTMEIVWYAAWSSLNRLFVVVAICASLNAGAAGASASLVDRLTGIRTDVSDTVAQAEAAGHALIADAGRQMLEVIDAALAAFTSGIGEVDTLANRTFFQAEQFLAEAENVAAFSFTEAHVLAAESQAIVRSLPFSSGETAVFFVSSTLLQPGGTDWQTITVIGAGIGASDAEATLDGVPVRVLNVTDNELAIKLPASALSFDKKELKEQSLVLRYTVSQPGSVGALFGAEAEVETRMIPVTLLPFLGGTWELVETVPTRVVERMDHKVSASLKGRDKEKTPKFAIPDDLWAAGWRIDTNAVRTKMKALITKGKGHHSHINNIVSGSINERSVEVSVWLGSTRDNQGRKRDARRKLSVTLPLVRALPGPVDTRTTTGVLETGSDTVVPRDLRAVDAILTVRPATGGTFVATPETPANPPNHRLNVEKARFVLTARRTD